MTRKEARDIVFTLLYECEFQKDSDAETVFAVSVENREIDVEADTYISAAYYGVCTHREELDEKIAAYSGSWKPERMSRIARNILRLAAYELLYMPEIPRSVVINEAVELAKRYEDERAPGFINGILHALSEEARK